MLSFFRFMLPVALLKRSPADVPHSSSLCVLAIGWTLALSLVVNVLMGFDAVLGLANFLVSLIVYCLLLGSVLRLANKQGRFLQTLTAGAGAAAVLLLFELPVGLLMQSGFSIEDLAGLFLGFFVWSLMIDGFILSKALEIHRVPATALALVMTVIQMSILPVGSGTT